MSPDEADDHIKDRTDPEAAKRELDPECKCSTGSENQHILFGKILFLAERLEDDIDAGYHKREKKLFRGVTVEIGIR